MIKPADHVAEVPYSPIRIVLDRIHERLAQGKEAISLCIGEPDFDTPAHIVEAMAEAARKGATRYVPNIGIPELRQAICDKRVFPASLRDQVS
jgi:aspartate aminotransferase